MGGEIITIHIKLLDDEVDRGWKYIIPDIINYESNVQKDTLF